MDNRTKWINTRIRRGWMFLAAGVLIAVVGVFTELQFAYLPFNFRIITGSGILFAGIGAAYLIRYTAALKDAQSAKRLTVEEHDERTLLIRTRAGNRAYWLSISLTYIGLMWASFGTNSGLPALSGNTLWSFLVIAVLAPFGVYVASIVIDQRNS